MTKNLQSKDNWNPNSASDFSKYIDKEVNDEGGTMLEVIFNHKVGMVNNSNSQCG